MKQFYFLLLFILAFKPAFSQYEFGDSIDWESRPNGLCGEPVFPDPNVYDGSSWTHVVDDTFSIESNPFIVLPTPGTPLFDENVSYVNDGSGSIKLSNSWDWPQGDSVGDAVVSDFYVPAEYGKHYTFSCRAMTDGFPFNDFEITVQFVNAGGYPYVYPSHKSFSFSKVNEWEECVLSFALSLPEQVGVRIGIRKTHAMDGVSNNIWLDDFAVIEGVGSREKVSQKNGFDGTQTRMDALGNFQVNRNGNWEPYFPFGIYGTAARPDFSIYSDQGFNCFFRVQRVADIRRCKNAVSSFNPNGMMAIPDLTAQLLYGSITADSTRSILQSHIDSNVVDNILTYYIDNEQRYVYEEQRQIALIVDSMTRNAEGKRSLPLYMLLEFLGDTRRYQNAYIDSLDDYKLVNSTGTYIRHERTDYFKNQDHLENNTIPNPFMQINWEKNRPAIRPDFYKGLGAGARAFGHWKDQYGSMPDSSHLWIENSAYWSDIVNLRSEVDQLMPLIRQPHWTDWKVEDDQQKIRVYSRDLYFEGHVIASNFSSNPVETTVKVTDLDYVPLDILDYFTGNSIAVWDAADSSFTVTIDGYGSGVYVLKKPDYSGLEEQKLEFKISPNPSLTNFFFQSNMEIDELFVTDLSGRVVDAFSKHTVSVDVSDYPSGVYVVTAKKGDKVYSEKFVKP